MFEGHELHQQLGEAQAHVRLPRREFRNQGERANANLEAKQQGTNLQGKKPARTLRKALRKHGFTGRTTSTRHRKAFEINVAWA